LFRGAPNDKWLIRKHFPGIYFSFSGSAKTKSVEAGCAMCAAASG
jgi:hypothetical protein